MNPMHVNDKNTVGYMGRQIAHAEGPMKEIRKAYLYSVDEEMAHFTKQR